MKKKLTYFSMVATPMQIKFSDALQEYFDAHIFFYGQPNNRPDFWKTVPLGEHSSVLSGSREIMPGKYYNAQVPSLLDHLDPDILLLGGPFIPSNYIAYRWAVKHQRKVFLLGELFWVTSIGEFRPFWKRDLLLPILSKVYKNINGYLAIGERAVKFYSEKCRFDALKVHKAHYPCDVEEHLGHRLRSIRKNVNYLFPHRLHPLYNPLLALKWFSEIQSKYPASRLTMNGSGPLREDVDKEAKILCIEKSVRYTDGVSRWQDLHHVYENCDIVISTKSIADGQGDWSMAEAEAAASGMGFIVKENSKGLCTALRENHSGFVISKPESIEEVMRAVDSYMNVPNLLTEHSARNKQIGRNFSPMETAKAYHHILNS